MPSLKPPVEKMFRRGLVYQLTCPGCDARYVGETCRHMLARFKEHTQKMGPMKKHLQECLATLTEDHVEILQMTSRREEFLLTLEALHTVCPLMCDIAENCSCYFNFFVMNFILLYDNLYNMPGLSKVRMIAIEKIFDCSHAFEFSLRFQVTEHYR